jgi:hypothetical protein
VKDDVTARVPRRPMSEPMRRLDAPRRRRPAGKGAALDASRRAAAVFD